MPAFAGMTNELSRQLSNDRIGWKADIASQAGSGSSDFSRPPPNFGSAARSDTARIFGKSPPELYGPPRPIFQGRRKWFLMAIDARASDRGPTPAPPRVFFAMRGGQGRCVREAWSREGLW